MAAWDTKQHAAWSEQQARATDEPARPPGPPLPPVDLLDVRSVGRFLLAFLATEGWWMGVGALAVGAVWLISWLRERGGFAAAVGGLLTVIGIIVMIIVMVHNDLEDDKRE